MEHVSFENVEIPPDKGFQVRFVTMKHNSPLHWHREMEILYILNGSAVVQMEGKKYRLKPLDLIVIDSALIHDVIYALPQTMGICIHISKSYMRQYLPDIELIRFVCNPESAGQGKEEGYSQLCEYVKDLTVSYFEQKSNYPLISGALILQILGVLVEQFGQQISGELDVCSTENRVRLEQIFHYVEKNYKETISLQDAADELGLNKEYFCRLFKRCTGMTLMQYVNQVRLNHIYQDLLYGEGSVQEIMERHGMNNIKLFYRLFKERYGCTPKKMQKMSKENPLL